MEQRPAPGSGSAPDFATYVEQRRRALVRAAWAITGDPHTAEDLVQAVLVKVEARWGSIREPRAVDAYIRRALLNQYRTWSREPRATREWVTDEPLALAAVPAPEAEEGRALWPLVAALPPRQRAAVALRYYEGLSEAETARVLSCSVGAIKSNTSRGLATLRRLAAHDPERFIA